MSQSKRLRKTEEVSKNDAHSHLRIVSEQRQEPVSAKYNLCCSINGRTFIGVVITSVNFPNAQPCWDCLVVSLFVGNKHSNVQDDGQYLTLTWIKKKVFLLHFQLFSKCVICFKNLKNENEANKKCVLSS